jgi:UDP-N-acetylglucosamine diphosphorylase/glucosamine-1-phosphate N-acetyltransferase
LSKNAIQIIFLFYFASKTRNVNFILFDDERYANFLPLTYTRPVAEIRCGILTIQEKWEHIVGIKLHYKTMDYLQEKFPFQTTADNVFINSGLFPSKSLTEAILNLKSGDCLIKENTLLAARMNEESAKQFDIANTVLNAHNIIFQDDIMVLNNLWDIFSLNDRAIRDDFQRLTQGRTSQPISSTNQVIGDQLFIEEGAKVECSMINTSTGPVYIGRDAEIMEGCMVRGPFALGSHAVLKMGAKVYGATTLGEGCKVGGEVNNVVFFANSSKAHDGFVGNAVIGEWCNIGADSNNSNLKNNYEEVKLWSESKNSFVKTGLQFCGLIMGDHSKCGINTMFNTGTVVGVSCNIYGAGFPRNFVPSFSWGSAAGFTEYQINKAANTAARVFARRNLEFDAAELRLFQKVYLLTAEQRAMYS